jgi:NitT/TauT family transport system substrate-binding protein
MKTSWIKTLAAIGLTLAGIAQAAAAGNPLRIGWVYAMANAPVVVADKNGYFAQEGLEVKIIEFASGPVLNQALAAGELDMAYVGTPPVYHWFSRGLESRILAKVNYGQAAVVARKDAGINQVADLKGKKLAGVRKGSGMDVLVRGYVLGEKARLDADKDVQIIAMPSGNMPSSVEEKVVDAAFMWEPFTSQSLARGNTKIVLDMNQTEPGHPWYVVMALPDTLKNRKADVLKALRAHKKAVDYLNSSPTAGNDIIAAAFKLQAIKDGAGKEHSPAMIVADARKRLGWQYELTGQDLAFIQRLMNYSLDLGFIKKEMKPTDLVDLSYMQEALSTRKAMK